MREWLRIGEMLKDLRSLTRSNLFFNGLVEGCAV